jgi:hypothetical protein
VSVAIRFRCERCGKDFAVKERFSGKKTKCDGCGLVLVVPQTSAVEEEGAGRRDKFITFTQLTAKPAKRKKKAPVGWIFLVLIVAAGAFFGWRYFNTPYRKGRKLFEAGSYAEAAKEFQNSLNAGSSAYGSHVYLARIHAIGKEYAEATEECKKAIKAEPKARGAYLYLIVIYQLDGQLGEAEKLWNDVSNMPGIDRGFVLAKIEPPPAGGLTAKRIDAYHDMLKGRTAK